MSNRASDIVANGSAQVLEGDIPAVTTMVDSKGNTIAWLYSQRRFEVPSDRIADTMKLAIVAIEGQAFRRAQRRGLEGHAHRSGRLRLRRLRHPRRLDHRAAVRQNYQLLVLAQNDAERRAAVAPTPRGNCVDPDGAQPRPNPQQAGRS